MNKTVFNLELGILLPIDDTEYSAYSGAFDKKHAYYDETYLNGFDLEELKQKANEYLAEGVNGTYAVITDCWFDDELEEEVRKEIEEQGFITESVDVLDGEQYRLHNVVWSNCKTTIGYFENFIK